MPRRVLMVSQDVDGCIFRTDWDLDPKVIARENSNLIHFIVRKSLELKITHLVFVNGSARRTKFLDLLNSRAYETMGVFEGIRIIKEEVTRYLPKEIDVSLVEVTVTDALLAVAAGQGFAQASDVLDMARTSKEHQVYLAAHHVANLHAAQDSYTQFFTMHIDDKEEILLDLAAKAVQFPKGVFIGVAYPQYDKRGKFFSDAVSVREYPCAAAIDPDPFTSVRQAIRALREEEERVAADALVALSCRR